MTSCAGLSSGAHRVVRTAADQSADRVVQSAAIEGLFGAEAVPAVVAFEVDGDGDPDWLLPEERAQIDHASLRRQQQFSAGRACARAAMQAIGASAGPLLTRQRERGSRSAALRSPSWPAGVRGSISHTRQWCGAVAARADDPAARGGAIGLDGEDRGRVHEGLWSRLFTPPEIEHLDQLTDPTLSATVMFSVKEALYKAQFPVTESWVGFEDVRVEWGDAGLRLHPMTDLDALDALRWPIEARWLQRDELVITGVFAWPRTTR